MKLKNKKTGEIGNFCYGYTNELCVSWQKDDGFWGKQEYNSLAELNEEWEDYKEPEDFYIVEQRGTVGSRFRTGGEYEKKFKSIGNYFETKEEAEKAVEKLKAMAKLKEFGFRFIDWELDMKTIADGKIWFDVGVNTEWDAERLLELKPEVKKSLDILFGGEE